MMKPSPISYGTLGAVERRIVVPADDVPYRPSNAAEGDIFESNFCERCAKWRGGNCRINLKASVYDTGEKGYPKQWVYRQGHPVCTAFVLKGSQPPRPRKPKTVPGQGDFLRDYNNPVLP